MPEQAEHAAGERATIVKSRNDFLAGVAPLRETDAAYEIQIYRLGDHGLGKRAADNRQSQLYTEFAETH